jgi:hypothetical protein
MVDQAAEDTDARQLPKKGDTSEEDEYENKDNY